MWNPLNYLGYGSSPLQSSSQTLAIQQLSQLRNTITLPKYLIQQFSHYHKKIKQFQNLIINKCHSQQQNSKLIKIFSQLIHSLEEFSSMLGEVKREYGNNLSKIQMLDNCQRKIENHDNIVRNLIESQEKEMDGLVDGYRQKIVVNQMNLNALNKEIEEKSSLVSQVERLVEEFREKNQQLQKENSQLKKQLQSLQQKHASLQSTIKILVGGQEIPELKSPTQIKSPINAHTLTHSPSHSTKHESQNESLNLSIFLLSKFNFTARILNYLDIPSILSLSLTNKRIHSLISNQLPELLHHRMKSEKQKEIQRVQSESIYFNHVLFHQLDGDNTKINAIKYLFFNHKPGTYILTMFQEDITKLQDDQTLIISSGEDNSQAIADSPSKETTSPQQSKKSWRDYFKPQKNKKPQIQSVDVIKSDKSTTNQQKFSLAQLKNSQTFKKIQQQLSKSFHHHVFSLKLPKDLEQFGKVMTQQFGELKHELNSITGPNAGSQLTIREWTSKLLTLAKFLYLQSQQLWGLSQSIFSKLMEFERQNYQLKSEIQDLTQSQNGMRKLAEQLAKSKMQMQKRIWQSQRKNGFLKSSTETIQKVNEKLQTEIQSLQKTLQHEETRSYQLERQLSHCRQKLSSLGKRYKQKMEEFSQLKEEVGKISWI